MRRSIALAALALGLALQAGPLRAEEQMIQHLVPAEEQRVEVLYGDPEVVGGDAQRVEVVGGTPEQTIAEHVPPTPSEKAASRTAKFMLGVASAGVALGVMAASLLLL